MVSPKRYWPLRTYQPNQPLQLVKDFSILKGNERFTKLASKFFIDSLFQLKVQRGQIIWRCPANQSRRVLYMLPRICTSSKPQDHHARKGITMRLSLLTCAEDSLTCRSLGNF